MVAPRRSLALHGLKPSLEGRFPAVLHDGTEVTVRPVFALLREQLAEYTPEKASERCGTPPSLIRRLARWIVRARSAGMVTTSNFSKYYHGNLIERTQALVFALGGHHGKKGSGFVAFPMLLQDGTAKATLSMFPLNERLRIYARFIPQEIRLRLAGYTEEMIFYERMRMLSETGTSVGACGSLFWYVHAGLLERSESLQDWDPYLGRPVREVLEESLARGWQHVWPKPGNDPRMLFVYGSNTLRRIRGYPAILETLWPKLHTVVTIDSRMTSTALQSDYVLPVSAWYERTEHKWVTPLMPFIHAGAKIRGYHESRSDWEILSRLARAVQERARARGLVSYRDRQGRERRLDDLYERFSNHGELGPRDDEKVARQLIEKASNLGGIEWEELEQRGWARFTSMGAGTPNLGNATEIHPHDTITPLTAHVHEKQPYPTLSRRMQFYLDHELYLEMGEALPVHKDPPASGGAYPLMVTGGHTRWSIHSSWRDDRLMLRQQRGEPIMYISAKDATARSIRDGERVRVHNDLGFFIVMARVAPAVRPGQLILYHAWENFQFPDGRGFQGLMPVPLNPVELAGGQFHLRPMVLCMQPSHTDRDTRVEAAHL